MDLAYDILIQAPVLGLVVYLWLNHITSIRRAIERVEKKIDDHLKWHAENK